MRARRVLMRLVGALYVVAGIANLLGLADPEIRAQIVSLSAVVLRYSMYIPVGIGMAGQSRYGVAGVGVPKRRRNR